MDERDYESIRVDLASEDDEIRRLAIERVAFLPGREAMPYLLGCLGDPSWRVRKAAVERIADAPRDWDAPHFLIKALADGDNPGRRNAAVEALVRCGAMAVPSLIVATDDPDVDVRKLVVDALAGIGDASAVGRLIEILDDPDSNVQGAAADALGMIGSTEAVPALLNVVKGAAGDRLVVFSALRALARIEVPVKARDLREALQDSILLPAAFAVLGRARDPEAQEVLLRGLASGSRSTREAAMAALLRLVAVLDPRESAELVLTMRDILDHHSALLADAILRLGEATLTTRLVLVQFLGLFPRKDIVIPILLAGRDEVLSEIALSTLFHLGPIAEQVLDENWTHLESNAKNLACRLLGRTEGRQGLERLFFALEEHDAELRTTAAQALGERQSSEAVPALVNHLEAAALAAEEDIESEEELSAVLEALVRIAKPESSADEQTTNEAIDLLASRLHGAAEPVRLAIASVLGRIGRAKDLALIEFMLKDPSPSVRRAAVEALARVEPGTLSEPLRLAIADESPTVRIAAANAFGASQHQSALEDLQRLQADSNARVRAAAVRAIALFAVRAAKVEVTQEVTQRLRAALHDEGVVALAALSALDEVGGHAAAQAAQDLLTSSDANLVQAAVGCIGRHGDANQIETLIPLVGHESWSVRAEVIQIMTQKNVVRAVPFILRRLETEQDDFVRDAILRALKHLEQ